MHSHDAILKRQAQDWLAKGERALLLTVSHIKGSTPRNVGARMLVTGQTCAGTIGGGHLEWQAISMARQAMRESSAALSPWRADFALGPTLGQCCGGALTISFCELDESAIKAWPETRPRFHLELHGAGHVGQAIIQLLKNIECEVRWIDERSELDESDVCNLPTSDQIESLPPHIEWVLTDRADAEVAKAPANCCHLILTHRHDLDFRIIEAVLRKGDAQFIGLIGSATKRASFWRRLRDKGFDAALIDTIHCPIGIPGIEGKEPAVIATSVVAQLLLINPIRPATQAP